MSTSTSTIEQPQTEVKISITDINGIEQNPLWIDGQPIEQYFAQNSILTAPTKDQVTIVDGLPVKLDQPVEPFASVGVGLLADRG